MATPLNINPIPTQNEQNEIDLIKNNKLCYHHQQYPLNYYCDTCNETICNQCQIIGPHNTNYHRIISLQDAYNKRIKYINSQRPLLINKLNQLNNYNSLINELFEKVTSAKKVIERDVRKDFTQLTEKIKDIEGKRDTILSYEASQLQNIQNKILDIINYIKDVQESKNVDLISFLLQYKNVMNAIRNIMEKPIKEKIDLSMTENYPNDLEERHRILDDYKRIKQELVKKDESLWKILKEKKDKERENIIKEKEKSQNEIEEWVKLSDRYSQELKKYKVVCSFCGRYLDGTIVNYDCEANENFYLNFYFTIKPPREKFINSKRHFFGEPCPDLEQRMKQANFMWKKQQEEIERKRKEEEERIQREIEEEERREKEEEERIKREKEEEEERIRKEKEEEEERIKKEKEEEEERIRKEKEEEDKKKKEEEEKDQVNIHESTNNINVEDNNSVKNEENNEKEKSINEEEKSIHEEEKSINEEEKSIHEEEKSINKEEKSIHEEEKSINKEEKSIHEDEKSVKEEEKSVKEEEKSIKEEEKSVKEEEKSVKEEEKSIKEEEKSVKEEEKSVKEED